MIKFNIVGLLVVFSWVFVVSASANRLEKEMRFELQGNGGNCNGCEWILAEGTITKNTPSNFARYLRSSGSEDGLRAMIRFNSPGGSLLAGLELGRMMRKSGALVTIGSSKPDENGWYEDSPGVCISACAYAFLGGDERWLFEDEKLGFHQFYDKRAIEDFDAKIFDGYDRVLDQVITGYVANYLIEMGIDPNLYVFSSKVPPKEVQYISLEDALRWNVASGKDTAEKWELIAFEKGLVARFRTRISNREFRIYCRKTGPELAVIFPGLASLDSYFLSEIGKHKLSYDTKDIHASNLKFKTAAPLKDGKRSVHIYRLSKLGAQQVAKAASLWVHVDPDPSRAASSWFYNYLTVEKLNGDSRLPLIALKNCIN